MPLVSRFVQNSREFDNRTSSTDLAEVRNKALLLGLTLVCAPVFSMGTEVLELVPKKGLEPPHPCGYMDLNHARLPIPPLRLLGCVSRNSILPVRRTYCPILQTLVRVSNIGHAAARGGPPKGAVLWEVTDQQLTW